MSLEVGEARRQLRALSHPLRLRILSLITGRAMSSAELARELGLSHAAVSFHMRQLEGAGFLELAETRTVRGGQERRYRQRAIHRSEWTPEDPQLMVRAVAEELARRIADGSSATWRLFADAELWVRPEAWDEARSRIADAMKDLHEAASAPGSDATVRISATTLLLNLDADEPSPESPPAPSPTRRRRRA